MKRKTNIGCLVILVLFFLLVIFYDGKAKKDITKHDIEPQRFYMENVFSLINKNNEKTFKNVRCKLLINRLKKLNCKSCDTIITNTTIIDTNIIRVICYKDSYNNLYIIDTIEKCGIDSILNNFINTNFTSYDTEKKK